MSYLFLHPDLKEFFSENNYNRFQVYTPDDVEITINLVWASLNFWSSNVYITTPSNYKGITKGMCGNRNGNKNDDLMLRDGTVIKVQNGAKTPLNYADDWK